MKTSTSSKQSKLAQYTAVAGALIAGSNVNAQIVYTDVSPDAVLDSLSAPYMLDFNNDANPDLIFSVQHVVGSASTSGVQFTYVGDVCAVEFPAGNQVIGAVSSSSFAISALNAGDPISAAQNFGGSSSAALAVNVLVTAPGLGTFPISQGAFLAASNKFLGAKFVVGANTHYGWVQLSANGTASQLTIHDFAFNGTPSGALNAGQMVGLENVNVEDKVSIKTTLNNATINVTPDLIGGLLQVVSINGQVVKSTNISDINTTIEFEGINTGIYTISAQFEAGKVSKRVYVK
jgi:hypothetical protein